MNNDELINRFIEYLSLERNYSNNTVLAYKNNLKKLNKFSKINLKELNTAELKKYLKTLHNLSNKTVSHNISTIKAFYSFLLRNNIIDFNPAEGLIRPKDNKILPTYLSLEETLKLIDIKIITPYDARNKAILELLYSSGVRITELTNLEMANIDIENCLIRVMGKGSKERIIPLGDYAIDEIGRASCRERV